LMRITRVAHFEEVAPNFQHDNQQYHSRYYFSLTCLFGSVLEV